ncbi:hypothetical protein AB4Y38_25005 [Paraburkholderia sp. EG285A]|uniref:DUF6911 family protein n=1 Tax=Paraburkholderia sp. EG285A TaxID=3237009 RepID=UPI0034D39070
MYDFPNVPINALHCSHEKREAPFGPGVMRAAQFGSVDRRCVSERSVMNGIIGGYVGGVGAKRAPLNPVFGPDLIMIERLVELFNEQDGLVVLRVLPVSTPLAYELSLYAEHGMFVLLLNMIEGNDNAILDILSLSGLDFGFVSVPGDIYPRRAVTRDFAVVRRIFRVVAELGSLPVGSSLPPVR